MTPERFRWMLVIFSVLFSLVFVFSQAAAGAGRLLPPALSLPAATAVILFLFRFLSARDPQRSNYPRFQRTYDLLLTVVAVFLTGLQLVLLASLAGWMNLAGRLPVILLGMALLVAGNALPRLRPNAVLGIRLPWTCGDETVWYRTHRLAGYLIMGYGILVLAAGSFIPRQAGRIIAAGGGVLVVVFLLSSRYIFFRHRPTGKD